MSEDILKSVCRGYMKKKCNSKDCNYIHDTKLCSDFFWNMIKTGENNCRFNEKCNKNHFITENINEIKTPINKPRRKKPKNTESWDPIKDPYDMRILVENNEKYFTKKMTSRDVTVACNVFKYYKKGELYERLFSEITNCKVPKDDLLKLWHGSQEKKIEGTHLICNDRTNWKKECPTFVEVINTLVDYFNVKPEATRLNWYTNHEQWKPLHHDSAYVNPEKAKIQNITIAVSFGATRDIIFQNATSRQVVCLPQEDGCVYTFGNTVNAQWRHGVQPGCETDELGRISIIIWGGVNGIEEI
jgi:hypothetical protein